MVLQELGNALRSSLERLNHSTVVNDEVLEEVVNGIVRALLQADVSIKIVGSIKNNIKTRVNLEDAPAGTNRRKLIQRAVQDELVGMLEPETEPYTMRRGRSNVILFVGLQGSGKTTTIAKFANYYRRKGWKVCMVCADTFRAGALDQLRQNATKLNVPFYGSYTEADPVHIAEEGVRQFREEKFEVIIVDTSGRHRQEAALFDEMQDIREAVEPDNIVFVMDATQGQAVFDQASSFREAVPVGSVVVTKLDGHAKGGGALSAVAATASPIIFLGTGEHFDDLEPFNARSFVSRMLGMGDVRGFWEEVKSTMDTEKTAEQLEKLGKGKFTLRDMYEQFENVMKLGPLNKVMGMLPGMANVAGAMGNDNNDRLKVFLVIMDSCTAAELDGRVQITPERQLRIARGSGRHPVEVQMLLKCQKQFEQVVKKMGKAGLMRGSDEQVARNIQRNPNVFRQGLARAMNPQMLAQLGGSDGVMSMLKELAQNGGMEGGGP